MIFLHVKKLYYRKEVFFNFVLLKPHKIWPEAEKIGQQ